MPNQLISAVTSPSRVRDAAGAMSGAAWASGIKGAGGFLIYNHQFQDFVLTKLVLSPGAEPFNDHRNLLQYGLAKMAFTFRTRQSSGATGIPVLDGEATHRGAMIYNLDPDHILIIWWSGGTEAQDLQIVEAGRKVLMETLD